MTETVHDPRLPKAALIFVRWTGWRFTGLYGSRLANAYRLQFGPLAVQWRRPWLKAPADVHLSTLRRSSTPQGRQHGR